MGEAPLVFFWENFGPMHVDRVEAVAAAFPRRRVIGLEFRSRSASYRWVPPQVVGFEKRTLFQGDDRPSRPRRIGALRRACAGIGRGDYFFCHYEWPEVFVAAALLRLGGSNVVTMGCAKFDDKPRWAGREFAKRLAFLPYAGAIGSGRRSADYFRFLGLPRNRIATEYNTLSVARLRRQAGVEPAPAGVPFAERDFVAVARLVPKKNLAVLLEAFAGVGGRRRLHLVGDGPLEPDLRRQVQDTCPADRVVFHGFVQTEAVSTILAGALALILPSTEEQFGNVVIEAQALGVPVIVSDACGARDRLVRTGVNGFVVEPDNPDGLRFFMGLVDRDETLWRRLASASAAAAEGGDVARFVEAVAAQVRM